jgi:hypothetical protein
MRAAFAASSVPQSQLTVLALDVSQTPTPADVPASRVELAGPVMTRESTGRLRWSGTLRNTGGIQSQFNNAVLIARNGSGQLIDCGFRSEERRGGEEWPSKGRA